MISIVIPFVRETDLLKEAVNSALQQANIEKEIIVICNAPDLPDTATIDFLSGSGALLIHEPDPGSPHARNAGMKNANGEWIQYLDVDDLLLENKIFHQLENSQHADIIVSPHLFQKLNGHQEKSKWLAGDIWIGLLNSGLGSTSSMLWKRDALLEVGGWNVDFQSHQEYELLFRLLQAGKKITALDLSETIVRERASGSITKMTQTTRGIEGVNLRELMWMHIGRNGLETAARKNAFLQYIFRQLRGLFKNHPGETMEKYREHFSKKGFVPVDIGIPGYNWLFKTFGFRSTEYLMKIYSGLRVLIPFLPKND